MFQFFKKKEVFEPVNVSDDAITALASGKMIDITTVNDPMFSQKMMGDGVAFQYEGSEVTICAPANGTLSVLFPTGHAFGITTNQGVELLVHIGINTVDENGKGFTILNQKQGNRVKAGDPIVKVDLNYLKQKYDMSTMLIVTNPNGQEIQFQPVETVTRGQNIRQ